MKKSDSWNDIDHRTLDASDNVIIITINITGKNPSISNYYYGNNSVIHHERIELSEHEYEPSNIYMKNIGSNERQLTMPQLQETYKCTCGTYSLKPVKDGLRHQSIIECQCSECHAKMFIELPCKK